MSRSNNVEIKNPSQKYFSWDGENGGFEYWDKENKKNVEVPFPFRFIVLDQLSTIRGFSDADQCGFYSNEVRNTKTEPLTVKNKKGFLKAGLYEAIKDELFAKGAKYSKSVYIAYFEGKSLAIGQINIKGASLGPWIEFCNKFKVMETGIQVKSQIEGKKGKTVYQMPVFEEMKVSEETNQAAIDLDKELQAYFNSYFAKNAAEPQQAHQGRTEGPSTAQPAKVDPEPSVAQQDGIDDLPF